MINVGDAGQMIDRIEEKLGYRVRRLIYKGEDETGIPILNDEEIESLVNEISLTESEKIILDITGGNIRLLPYREK